MIRVARLLSPSYGRLATGGAQPARVARLPLPSGECCDAIARGGIEASGVADVAVLDGVLDVAGSGDADAHPGTAHTPVKHRRRQGPVALSGRNASSRAGGAVRAKAPFPSGRIRM